ncbi:hypothetical protein LTR32_006358 [Rachicladosporium monterosium]|uniref:Uncharacterized protein n=1 Tax=Rachicladosporium monterosium TaxID=1507873 RepID=A0ABR0KZB5_9PEZI|nr:hypothetical protein LTR32_006358 [Rachicladosporium monterosium]
MSSRTRLTFHIALPTKPTKLTIQITDPRSTTANNLALATWGSSEILANQLHLLPVPDFSGTGPGTRIFPILELGAGTGLVGLSAAAIWCQRVCLTDLEPIVPNLEANVQVNADVLAGFGGRGGEVGEGAAGKVHHVLPIANRVSGSHPGLVGEVGGRGVGVPAGGEGESGSELGGGYAV